MAKYDITYPDGEKETIELFGPFKQREWKIEQLERSGISPKQRIINRENALKQAQVSAGASGLPSLKGSDKQIAWAETIRAEKLRGFSDYLAKLREPKSEEVKAKSGLTPDEWERYYTPFQSIVNSLESQVTGKDNAAWWIDNRQNSFTSMGLFPLFPELEKRNKELQDELKAKRQAVASTPVAQPLAQHENKTLQLDLSKDGYQVKYAKSWAEITGKDWTEAPFLPDNPNVKSVSPDGKANITFVIEETATGKILVTKVNGHTVANSRVKVKEVAPVITTAEPAKGETSQTPHGQRVDVAITAKTIFPDTDEGRAQWRKNKNQGDMQGIDTRRSVRITPKRPKIGR